MRLLIKSLLLLFIVLSCKSNTKTQILRLKPNHNSIVYEGRVGYNKTKSTSEIYWSGTSIKVNFQGTSVKAIFEDEKGLNYFNIILDGKPVEVLKLKKELTAYVLADSLVSTRHSIEITKRNEWTYGKSLFYGFEIEGIVLEPNEDKKVFIEYYGDSITVGHGNEDEPLGKDRNDGNVTNNYNTYAAITARNLNAEYTCIARSGIGVTVSWFNMIMPEMYYRLDPSDELSKWDFSKKQPDIVVVNLFQNDSWIVKRPNHEEFKRRFGTEVPTKDQIIKAYTSFISKIRGHYPNTSIVCLLGNMDITKEGSLWPNYVIQAVDILNDKKVYTCFVPYKNTKKHPQVSEHKLIAEKLTKLIRSKILIN